ncbi:hypothetical protein [Variovorax sp. J22R115]|uniref:hypothetical protein n=1 Tax=Variovorax sp. J22R115 TaxID=3053509 RepID=UPI00257838F4|nr:hypothetical protein [Variovorax sp. J22R115]MDM0053564.1 hypothetical protein [Variovorax sp. J22R115]
MSFRLSALSIVLLAAGCGGGGGGGYSTTTPNPSATREVSGTAAKGIIRGGLVQVFAIDAQGKKSTSPIAADVKTGSDGTFTVAIPNGVLLFVIEVSAAPGAIIVDEATGLDLPVPANMVMRNVVTLAEGANSYTGAVTPLTEMSVRMAEKLPGGLTLSNVTQAKQGLRAAFGFDPETVKPINSNSPQAAGASEQQKIQALILAAISKMSKDGALGCAPADLKCVVEALSNAATLSGSSMTLGKIGATLEEAAKAVAADDTINMTGKRAIDLLPAIKDPVVVEPVPPVQESGVETTKKLFASLRNNLNAIADGKTVLEAQASAISDDFSSALAPVDKDLANWLSVPTFAIDYLADFKAGKVTNSQVNVSSGGCTVYSDAAYSVPATTTANALNIECAINRKFVSGSYDSATGKSTQRMVAQSMAITPAAGNTYQYTARSRLQTTVNGLLTSTDTIGKYGNTPNVAVGTITYAAGTNRANFSIHGQMPALTDAQGIATVDYEQWDLDGTVTTDLASHSTTYAVAGTLAAYLNGAQLGQVTVKPGSHLRVTSNTSGAVEAKDVHEFSLSVVAEAGTSTVSGAINMTNWRGDKQGKLYAPTVLAFSGTVAKDGTPLFAGELKYENTDFDKFDSALPPSDQNFLGQTMNFSGALSIPQRPKLKLSLSLSNGVQESGTLSGQYDDGTSVINFSAKRAAGASSPITATIGSTTGVSLSLTDQDVATKNPSVPVLKDGATTAILNLKTGVVSYSDGTFESLK